MGIYQNNLFIGDFKEPMIVHYNLQERETKRFLSAGRGPGETLPPVALYANTCEDNRLYRYSKQMCDLGYYLLDSLSSYVPLFQLSRENQNILPYEKDQYLVAGSFLDGYRYRVLNKDGIVLHSFGDYPNFLDGEKRFPYNARAMYHQVRFANNYSKKKLIASSSHVLDIIDYSLGIAKETINRILLDTYDYDYILENFLRVRKKGNTARGVCDVSCDDKYIYILFDHAVEGVKKVEHRKEILIFDWDGQPIKKLTLNVDIDLITNDPFGTHSIIGLALHSIGDDEYYQIVRIFFE